MSTDAKDEKEAKKDLDSTDKLLKSFESAINDYAGHVKKAKDKADKLEALAKQKIVTYDDVINQAKAWKSVNWNEFKIGAYRAKASTIEKAIQAALQGKKLAVFFKMKGFSQAERERQKAEFKKLQARYDKLIAEGIDIAKDLQVATQTVAKASDEAIKKAQVEVKKNPQKAASFGWSIPNLQKIEREWEVLKSIGK
ncbi:MAG TPA: hypothetical protein VGE52_10990, partial [Pirellulales bacterium]